MQGRRGGREGEGVHRAAGGVLEAGPGWWTTLPTECPRWVRARSSGRRVESGLCCCTLW